LIFTQALQHVNENATNDLILEAGIFDENSSNLNTVVMLETSQSLSEEPSKDTSPENEKLDDVVSVTTSGLTANEVETAVFLPADSEANDSAPETDAPKTVEEPRVRVEVGRKEAETSIDETPQLEDTSDARTPKEADKNVADGSEMADKSSQEATPNKGATQPEKAENEEKDVLASAAQYEGMAHSALMTIETWLIVICLTFLILLVGGIYLCIVWLAKRRVEDEGMHQESNFAQSTVHPLVGGKDTAEPKVEK